MPLPNRKPLPLNIFDLHHIDPALSKETVDMLKRLFAFYHKKHWGYEKLFRTFQRRNLLCNVVAGKAVLTELLREVLLSSLLSLAV